MDILLNIVTKISLVILIGYEGNNICSYSINY